MRYVLSPTKGGWGIKICENRRKIEKNHPNTKKEPKTNHYLKKNSLKPPNEVKKTKITSVPHLNPVAGTQNQLIPTTGTQSHVTRPAAPPTIAHNSEEVSLHI